MTIMNESRTVWTAEPQRPAYGPTLVNGWGEGDLPMRAVVRVAIAVTRDQLLHALAEHVARIELGSPDELTAERTRELVEYEMSAVSEVRLSAEADHLWKGFERWTDAERAWMDGLARAVDRAYPPDAFSPVVVDGSPRAPRVRCTAAGCTWAREGVDVEPLMRDGLAHSEQAHPEVRP